MSNDFSTESRKKFEKLLLEYLTSNMPDDPKDLFEYVDKNS